MKKFILLSILLALLLSCNIFNPSGKGKSAEDLEDRYGVEAVILEGKKYMWEENWVKAAKYFHAAVNMDSSKSEAWFYLGKSILRIYDVDLTNIWDEVNFSLEEGESDSSVPFLYKPEDPNVKVTDSLPSGQYHSSMSEVNFISIVDSVFYNDSINDFDTIFSQQLEVVKRDFVAYTLIDSVFLDRMRVYDGMQHSRKMLEVIHTRAGMDGKIRREQYEPDYFVASTVTAVLGMIDADTSTTLDWTPRDSGNVDERDAFRILCEAITNVENIEFDGFKEISTDPKGINSKIDIVLNTFEKADLSGELFKQDILDGQKQGADLDPSMVTNITDNFDVLVNLLSTFYYDDFVDNDSDWSYALDTIYTNNGKPDRMIWIDWDNDKRIDINPPGSEEMHIGDPVHMAMYPSYYKMYLPDLVDSTKISDSIKRFEYYGGYCYEFIGGDWGVDEEIMDGEDNDGDGIADEDTRVVGDTLDDDGDWVGNDKDIEFYDSLPMIVDKVNGLSINITGNFKNVPIDDTYRTRHLIGFTLLNQTFPDSLPVYLDSTYNGDFIGGDYGMDEEFYDGIDNDGDGLTDEDVGEYLPDESLRDEIIAILEAKGLR